MESERRPLATRERPFFQRVAAALIRAGVPPNAISVSSVFFAGLAGLALVATGGSGGRFRGLFLAAAAGIQLRLLANMLDGMVAVGSGDATPLGDVFNEVPDRLADAIILVAAGYALGGSVTLGYVATILAVLTAYVRALGTAHGARGLFLGPMAKPHRMAALTAACLWAATVPAEWPGGAAHPAGAVEVALWTITLGAAVTVVRRLARLTAHLRGSA